MPHSLRTTFYDLPAELRNEIYNYALIYDTPIELPYAYEKRKFEEPALLSTSSWIRTEAAPIFYGCNVFEAPSPPSAHQFLRQLSAEKISKIRMFRPIDLVLPLSAHRRWFDALRANINRLVLECGRGVLAADTVYVPIRSDAGESYWVKLEDIDDFKVVHGDDGAWVVQWREGFGKCQL